MSLPEYTIHYKTYLKTTIVDGLEKVFLHHPDPHLATVEAESKGVKATLEFPRTKNRYPAVVVRFYEREIKNFGVGHEELILVRDTDALPTKFQHYLYDGDIEFGIYALTSYDRDVMSDSIVQTITMGTLQNYTDYFYNRVYSSQDTINDALSNFVNFDSDTMVGFGEQTLPVPWNSEDDLLYQTSYRVKVFGEFYSPIPIDTVGGLVENVDLYPWIGDLETQPTGADDPAEWV